MEKELWYDQRDGIEHGMLDFVSNEGYTGVMLKGDDVESVKMLPKFMTAIIYITEKELKKVQDYIQKEKLTNYVIASDNEPLLKNFKCEEDKKCLFLSVSDKASMYKAIKFSKKYSYVIIEFESSTNIPLELILAYSQKNKCKVFKKVKTSDDGWVSTMTMEMGSFGVLLISKDKETILKLKAKVDKLTHQNLKLCELVVDSIEHIGMGERVCIDTIQKLAKDEGALIGSTSSGGVLVSSENHFLPYMELRPFRVNAGAIHSYVYCPNDTTYYLSELKAGDRILVVNAQGESREVSVGRVKMERRPMLLIKCTAPDKTEINCIVQDDWHIRIIGKGGQVRNATELKEGEVILGYVTSPGRHLGVKISETIIEK